MRISSVRRERFFRKATKRRGAYTVEFAICAAVLFMVVMANLEFTRLVFARHAVDQAAYEAARVAIVPGATDAAIRSRAKQLLDATGIKSASIFVTPNPITADTLQVSVRVEAPLAANSWVPPHFLTGANLEATTTLDHEQASYKLTP